MQTPGESDRDSGWAEIARSITSRRPAGGSEANYARFLARFEAAGVNEPDTPEPLAKRSGLRKTGTDRSVCGSDSLGSHS